MSDEQVSRTVYQGGSILATDNIELDMDIYTLTVKGNVVQEGGAEAPVYATPEYVDAQDEQLQTQITALEARIAALENPTP